MDNLDVMITEALSYEYEPDERLMGRTLALIRQNRKQNIIAINLILLVNALGIVLAGVISVMLPPGLREACLFFIVMWLTAVIPVYVIARLKFARI